MFNITEYRDELTALRDLITANASSADCADFIIAARQSVALSHFVEDHAAPGTLAEQVFDILCAK